MCATSRLGDQNAKCNVQSRHVGTNTPDLIDIEHEGVARVWELRQEESDVKVQKSHLNYSEMTLLCGFDLHF